MVIFLPLSSPPSLLLFIRKNHDWSTFFKSNNPFHFRCLNWCFYCCCCCCISKCLQWRWWWWWSLKSHKRFDRKQTHTHTYHTHLISFFSILFDQDFWFLFFLFFFHQKIRSFRLLSLFMTRKKILLLLLLTFTQMCVSFYNLYSCEREFFFRFDNNSFWWIRHNYNLSNYK